MIPNSLSNKMYLFIHYLHYLFTFFFFMNIEMLFIFQILMFLKKNKHPQPIQPDFIIHLKYTLYFFFNFVHLLNLTDVNKEHKISYNLLNFNSIAFKVWLDSLWTLNMCSIIHSLFWLNVSCQQSLVPTTIILQLF